MVKYAHITGKTYSFKVESDLNHRKKVGEYNTSPWVSPPRSASLLKNNIVQVLLEEPGLLRNCWQSNQNCSACSEEALLPKHSGIETLSASTNMKI